MRVLLIEDNPGDARLVRELLRESAGGAGIALTCKDTLAEGLSALHDAPFDAILLDMSLPDGMGLPLVHRLRSEAAPVPIVILSGQGDEEQALQAVREGAQDYLVKGRVEGFGLVRSLNYAVQRFAQLQTIAALALTDPLTGLPNRASFLQSLAQCLAQASRYGGSLALLFLDLDGFKSVNDRYGHGAGDAVLKMVAERLRVIVRESDIVARLGGDEFTVTLPATRDAVAASAVARKIVDGIGAPMVIGSVTTGVTASIGIGIFPTDAATLEELIATADGAMYRAKVAGKNQVAC